MKRFSGNTVVGILFAIAACITLVVTNTSISSNSSLGDPGPTFFPTLVCVAVLILAIVIIIQSLRHVEKPFTGTLSDEDHRQGLIRMLLILADLGLFLVLWTQIPFLIAAIVFVFLQCVIFREKPLFTVIYSLAVPGVLYFAFTYLLKVNLNIY